MFLDCGRTLEYPEETHTHENMQSPHRQVQGNTGTNSVRREDKPLLHCAAQNDKVLLPISQRNEAHGFTPTTTPRVTASTSALMKSVV